MNPRARETDRIALLRWYIDAGVDEAIGTAPVNRFAVGQANPRAEAKEPTARPTAQPSAPDPRARPEPATPPPRDAASPATRRAGVPLPLESPQAAERHAGEIAAAAATLDALAEAMRAFDGCALRHTATNLVFGDGDPASAVMCVGEAPGADEDREGRPFVGVSGQLLDRMLAAIGLDRRSAYITNILPWRPPGNRKPTTSEVTVCLPFIRRHIAIVRPKVLVLVGGTSASALLGRTEGITRLRGRWLNCRPDPDDDSYEIPAMPIYHPAYLLRQPALKRDAWRDLVAIRVRLDSMAADTP
jgi:uracil-DNA glycosylase family 4